MRLTDLCFLWRVIASAVSNSEAIGWCFYTESPWLAGRCYAASLAAQALPPRLVYRSGIGTPVGQGDFPESHGMGTLSQMRSYDSIERMKLGAVKIAPDIQEVFDTRAAKL